MPNTARDHLEVKAEMKRTKEVKEAKKNVASDWLQKHIVIEESRELKEKRVKERKKELREERKRWKDAKSAIKAEKQENVALEMQKIPKRRGVGGEKKRGKWRVVFKLDGKKVHGGWFAYHSEAVAKVQQLRSMANSQ
jgi:hypothetical protein